MRKSKTALLGIRCFIGKTLYDSGAKKIHSLGECVDRMHREGMLKMFGSFDNKQLEQIKYLHNNAFAHGYKHGKESKDDNR